MITSAGSTAAAIGQKAWDMIAPVPSFSDHRVAQHSQQVRAGKLGLVRPGELPREAWSPARLIGTATVYSFHQQLCAGATRTAGVALAQRAVALAKENPFGAAAPLIGILLLNIWRVGMLATSMLKSNPKKQREGDLAAAGVELPDVLAGEQAPDTIPSNELARRARHRRIKDEVLFSCGLLGTNLIAVIGNLYRGFYGDANPTLSLFTEVATSASVRNNAYATLRDALQSLINVSAGGEEFPATSDMTHLRILYGLTQGTIAGGPGMDIVTAAIPHIKNDFVRRFFELAGPSMLNAVPEIIDTVMFLEVLGRLKARVSLEPSKELTHVKRGGPNINAMADKFWNQSITREGFLNMAAMVITAFDQALVKQWPSLTEPGKPFDVNMTRSAATGGFSVLVFSYVYGDLVRSWMYYAKLRNGVDKNQARSVVGGSTIALHSDGSGNGSHQADSGTENTMPGPLHFRNRLTPELDSQRPDNGSSSTTADRPRNHGLYGLTTGNPPIDITPQQSDTEVTATNHEPAPTVPGVEQPVVPIREQATSTADATVAPQTDGPVSILRDTGVGDVPKREPEDVGKSVTLQPARAHQRPPLRAGMDRRHTLFRVAGNAPSSSNRAGLIGDGQGLDDRAGEAEFGSLGSMTSLWVEGNVPATASTLAPVDQQVGSSGDVVAPSGRAGHVTPETVAPFVSSGDNGVPADLSAGITQHTPDPRPDTIAGVPATEPEEHVTPLSRRFSEAPVVVPLTTGEEEPKTSDAEGRIASTPAAQTRAPEPDQAPDDWATFAQFGFARSAVDIPPVRDSVASVAPQIPPISELRRESQAFDSGPASIPVREPNRATDEARASVRDSARDSATAESSGKGSISKRVRRAVSKFVERIKIRGTR